MKYDRDAYADLRAAIKIDRERLDDELIANSHNFHHAGEGFAYAKSRRDAAEAALERVKAELDNEVRERMVADEEKYTETQIKQIILRETEFKDAHKKYLAACLEADSWEALRNSYRQRADMLKSLVQLYTTGYFGELTGASERREARERLVEERTTTSDERPWRTGRQDPRRSSTRD